MSSFFFDNQQDDRLGAQTEMCLFGQIQDLRDRFTATNCAIITAQDQSNNNIESMLDQAIFIIRGIWRYLYDNGFSYEQADPAHALGHAGRDLINGLRLVTNQRSAPGSTQTELFIGFLGAVLHDIGCLVSYRYDDACSPLGHAEMGALLLQEIFEHENFGLSDLQQLYLLYTVAAHTHYLQPQAKQGLDGRSYKKLPYQDTFDLGKQKGRLMWPVWLTRWADRLDLVGPTYMGRHLLTLVDEHSDFDKEIGFYHKAFADQMALALSTTGGTPTMLGHLSARSQPDKNYPYNRFDSLVMRRLWQSNATLLVSEIEVVMDGVTLAKVKQRQSIILQAWEEFLSRNIEPTTLGQRTAEQITQEFQQLPAQIQLSWLAGFEKSMADYLYWAEETNNFLQSLQSSWLDLPGLAGGLEELIKPAGWQKILAEEG